MFVFYNELMGYFGKIELKLKVQKLRRKGWSYTRIKRKIPVSKDSISRWCRGIVLTKEQQEALIKNRKFGQRKGSIVAAENKKRERRDNIRRIFREAIADVGKVSPRDEFIAGISLYAAEGAKSDGFGSFANSDPALIKFMTNWLLEYGKVPMNKLRGAIWIHEGLDADKAKKYWSALTKIPENQFHKTYVAKVKTKSDKIRKNIHNFGVFSIRFSSSERQRRILGWISALLGSKIEEYLLS